MDASDFSLNLKEAVGKELRFLATINRHKGLLDDDKMLDWAIYRYIFICNLPF